MHHHHNNDGANGNVIVCLLNERYLDIPIFLSTSTNWYNQEISPYIVFFLWDAYGLIMYILLVLFQNIVCFS
jgi:hypothetical protein